MPQGSGTRSEAEHDLSENSKGRRNGMGGRDDVIQGDPYSFRIDENIRFE